MCIHRKKIKTLLPLYQFLIIPFFFTNTIEKDISNQYCEFPDSISCHRLVNTSNAIIFPHTYPIVPSSAEEIAYLIIDIENQILNTALRQNSLPFLAHHQQVLYRYLSERTNLSDKVISLVPSNWKQVVEKHILAPRRARGRDTAR